MNLHKVALADVTDRILRHRHAQPQQIALRQLDDGQRLGFRVGPGLDERARVGIAPDDDALERGRYCCVAPECPHALPISRSDSRALLRAGKRGLRRVDLRLRGFSLRASIVKLLRGNDARLLHGGFLEARVVGLKGRVQRLCAGNLVLRRGNRVLRAERLGCGTGILRCQLGHFQHSQHLPGTHAVADVDIDAPEIPGNLGMDVHHLEGLELSGERKGVGDGAALYRRDGYGGRLERTGMRGLSAATVEE